MRSFRWCIVVLALLVLGIPRTTQAQDFYRLGIRGALSGGMPTNTFSFSNPADGGFAKPGYGFQVGLQFHFTPSLSILGDVILMQFPIDVPGLNFYGDTDFDSGEWELLARNVCLRADFGEDRSRQVYLQIGLGIYRGATEMTEGLLTAVDPVKSSPTVSWGGGVLLGGGNLRLDLGARLHNARLELDNSNIRRASWASFEAGLIYSFWKASSSRERSWRP